MSWQAIEGHNQLVERFRQALARGRLASSFLFVGAPGVGKRAFAQQLAKALLCQNSAPSELNACEKCDSCVQVDAGTHPDLDVVVRRRDRSTIKLEDLIGEQERRGREGLCHNIALKPFMGGRKVAIIDNADDLNLEGANCLLKTLEEPPPRSVLILISNSLARQLPTIRSRCQTIRFQPLPEEVVARLLVKNGVISDPVDAARLAARSEGSLERAAELADAELAEFRKQLLGALAQPNLDSVRLSKSLLAYVDAAGREASNRRARARQAIMSGAEFYRQVLRGAVGAPASADVELMQAVKIAQSTWPDLQQGADCLDRCLEALSHVDRNANQATLLEAWLDDLAARRPPR